MADSEALLQEIITSKEGETSQCNLALMETVQWKELKYHFKKSYKDIWSTTMHI